MRPLLTTSCRRFDFFSGPTNSGKTHAALTALSQSPTGLYGAPLVRDNIGMKITSEQAHFFGFFYYACSEVRMFLL